MHILVLLKFTPLEFETVFVTACYRAVTMLKFTPLEFETAELDITKPVDIS